MDNTSMRQILFLCLLFLLVSSISAIPKSMLKNIELRQQKFCQVEAGCYNCSLAIERDLLLKAGRMIAGELAKTDQGVQSYGEAAMHLTCTIPRFRDQQQFCCELWQAFDCRSKIAAEQCSL